MDEKKQASGIFMEKKMLVCKGKSYVKYGHNNKGINEKVLIYG